MIAGSDTAVIKVRDDKIEGIGPWHWLFLNGKFEPGSWNGPAAEFTQMRERVLTLVKKQEVVVTAGGCQGMYPRLWAQYFKTVYAFEPDPLNYEVMCKNCVGDQFKLMNAALNEKSEPVNLHRIDRENVGMHSICRTNQGEQIVVNSVRLDDLKLEGLDLLQLDVEGAESFVLLGAWETINKYRPVITVETLDTNVANFMDANGYKSSGKVGPDTIFVPFLSAS